MSGDHNMNQTTAGWRKRQIALDKKAENARELGLDYEPSIIEMARRAGQYSLLTVATTNLKSTKTLKPLPNWCVKTSVKSTSGTFTHVARLAQRLGAWLFVKLYKTSVRRVQGCVSNMVMTITAEMLLTKLQRPSEQGDKHD